jgi:hypothetical protein
VSPHRPRHRLLQGRRPVLTHDQRRIAAHCYCWDDLARMIAANAEIGNASWCTAFAGIFGDVNAVLHYMPRPTARIIRFPERGNEIAKIRAELEEMRKTVRGGC